MPNLRVVIFYERDFWFAVCLDSFMVVKDKTFPGVFPKLKHVLESHIEIAKIEGVEPFTCFPPAPQEFWDRFEAASWQLFPRQEAPAPATELRVAA